uniref:Uncharacterized protein n=1 Tax=Arundo donax TaxID=35708 RepID=A0A0A9ERN2_ARUDO
MVMGIVTKANRIGLAVQLKNQNHFICFNAMLGRAFGSIFSARLPLWRKFNVISRCIG